MSCRIQFDNYPGRYCAGEVIIGKVICSFYETEDIRGIELKVKGKEKNKWTSYSGGRTHTESDTKKFLRDISTLQGEADIGPGRFEYPFTFQLPSDLPSTYVGHYGGIFYSISAKVDRPFAIDYTDETEIVVFSPINFNLIRNQLQLKPVYYSIDETMCSLCCDSGTITMDVHLEKKAFVVGEVVNVKINISNMSNVDVIGVSVELMMKIKSRVTDWIGSESKSNYELIASNNDWHGVVANGEKTYNIILQIPQSTEVPNFSICELFSQRTTLKIAASIDGCHTNMNMDLDVTLGHIPVDEPSAPAEQHSSNTHPPNTYTPIPQPPSSYQPNSDLQPLLPANPPEPNAVPRPIGFDNEPSAPSAEGGASAPPGSELPGYESAMEGEEPPSYSAAMSSSDDVRGTHSS